MIHLSQALRQPQHPVGPDRALVEAAGVDADGRVVVDEDVVLHEAVAPASDADGALRVHDEVAVHGDATDAVVEIDDEGLPVAGAANVVHVVVANDVVAVGPVAARVDGAHVAGLVTYVVDVVVLDQVVIAPEQDGAVRVVVDLVVGDARAHALQVHRRVVAARPAGLVMEVAVVDEVPAGGDALAVAPAEADAAVAVVPDIAALHAVVGAAVDPDAVVAGVRDAAAGDQAAGAAFDGDGVAPGGGELEVAQDDVAGTPESDEGTLEKRHHDLGAPQGFGGPQVEDAGGAVDEVLARRVELLEDVEEVDSVSGLEPVMAVRRAGLDEARLGVNGGDALVAVGPVVGPVAVHPGVVHGRPPARAVPFVEEAFFQEPQLHAVAVVAALALGKAGHAGERLVGIGVRPAGDPLGLAVDEELHVGRRHLAAETARPHRRQAPEAEGLEVHLAYVAARGGVQPGPDGGIAHRGEAGEGDAAEEAYPLIRQGAPGHRSLGTAAVAAAQAQGLGERVVAAAYPDGAAGALFRRQGSQGVARSGQSGERPLPGSGVCVLAIDSDVDLNAHGGSPYEGTQVGRRR